MKDTYEKNIYDSDEDNIKASRSILFSDCFWLAIIMSDVSMVCLLLLKIRNYC